MGMVVVKFKFMPSSTEVDFEAIKDKIREILQTEKVQNPNFEEEPIAFGLKALVAMFGWPEEKPLEELEENFKKIENVKSVELIDIRRAIG